MDHGKMDHQMHVFSRVTGTRSQAAREDAGTRSCDSRLASRAGGFYAPFEPDLVNGLEVAPHAFFLLLFLCEQLFRACE